MDIDVFLKECIEQAEQLKLQISNNAEASNNCLGGEMLSAYNDVRSHQLFIARKIIKKLRTGND